MEGKNETEEEPKESFGFMRDAFIAGQFVSGKIRAWKRTTPFLNSSTTGVRLPRHIVQDIDTEEDWEEAEIKFQLLKTNASF